MSGVFLLSDSLLRNAVQVQYILRQLCLFFCPSIQNVLKWLTVLSHFYSALPASVRTAVMHIAFRRQIKTLLFQASFSDNRT